MTALPRATKGHWPRGKRRVSTSSKDWLPLRTELRRAVRGPEPGRSMRALAFSVGVSTRTVRHWLAGEYWPEKRRLPGLRRWLDKLYKGRLPVPTGPKIDTSSMTRLGNRLTSAAEAQGLSLRQAAQQCGIDYRNLHRILRGERRPTVDTLERLAAGLQLDMTELWSLM